jgi:hypothetical protein
MPEEATPYMASMTMVFEDLPKTLTGKTQKFVLHKKAQAMGSLTKTDSGKVWDAEFLPSRAHAPKHVTVGYCFEICANLYSPTSILFVFCIGTFSGEVETVLTSDA